MGSQNECVETCRRKGGGGNNHTKKIRHNKEIIILSDDNIFEILLTTFSCQSIVIFKTCTFKLCWPKWRTTTRIDFSNNSNALFERGFL